MAAGRRGGANTKLDGMVKAGKEFTEVRSSEGRRGFWQSSKRSIRRWRQYSAVSIDCPEPVARHHHPAWARRAPPNRRRDGGAGRRVLAAAVARDLMTPSSYSANEFDTAIIMFRRKAIRAVWLPFLQANARHRLNAGSLKWKRVPKRVDLPSRSLVTLIGARRSCFAVPRRTNVHGPAAPHANRRAGATAAISHSHHARRELHQPADEQRASRLATRFLGGRGGTAQRPWRRLDAEKRAAGLVSSRARRHRLEHRSASSSKNTSSS